MNFKASLLSILSIVVLCSCNNFDSGKSDTKANLNNFKDFLDVPLSADVKNIYCYADEIGIDHLYQFAFQCNKITFESIISKQQLKRSKGPDNYSMGLWKEFSWWDEAFIETATPYFKKEEHEIYTYLWYDEKQGNAYYLTFDM